MPAPEPIFQLPRCNCIIRPYDPNGDRDVEPLAKAANSPKVAQFMTNRFVHPYTVDVARSWIAQATSASPMRDFAICLPDSDGGVVIGGIGLKMRDDIQYRTMEIGYWLGEEHWNQGIATEAVTAFSDWAFRTFPHLLRLEAGVIAGNIASGRVLDKAGFKREGRQRKAVEKHGVVRDILMHVMFRDER
jgi:RimJ/RimL family protein N-acetyltransferase